MHACKRIYTHTYMHIHIRTYTHIDKHIYKHEHTCICIYTCVHIYVCTIALYTQLTELNLKTHFFTEKCMLYRNLLLQCKGKLAQGELSSLAVHCRRLGHAQRRRNGTGTNARNLLFNGLNLMAAARQARINLHRHERTCTRCSAAICSLHVSAHT